MSRYAKIVTKFWNDEKIRSLSDDGRIFYLYVLTAPHSNMAGYYLLPKPYAMFDLQWDMERIEKAFDELLNKGLIKYCESSSVILIINFFKYNPIQNKNQAIGVNNRVAELPKNSLALDFMKICKNHSEQYYSELVKGLDKGLDEGLPNPVTVSVTETDNSNSNKETVVKKEEVSKEEKAEEKDVKLHSKYGEVRDYILNKVQQSTISRESDINGDLYKHSSKVIKKACDLAVAKQEKKGNYRRGDPKNGVDINSYKFIQCFINEAKGGNKSGSNQLGSKGGKSSKKKPKYKAKRV
ncbi:hypothetical protein [Halonatronum saccharophilum]|uniref:hypothetical protein n=1 Tax=Halonatronum saccharophilum TaxID=150060 RepID=UPI0004895421|nr:hypothetical protein [Halonatronum saccharophilum]